MKDVSAITEVCRVEEMARVGGCVVSGRRRLKEYYFHLIRRKNPGAVLNTLRAAEPKANPTRVTGNTLLELRVKLEIMLFS